MMRWTVVAAVALPGLVLAGVAVETAQRPSQVGLDLGRLGNDVGTVGAYCFLAAAALTGVVAVRRDGVRALPGSLVLPGRRCRSCTATSTGRWAASRCSVWRLGERED